MILRQKNISKGLPPLDSNVMALFDAVEEKHPQCAMDNLYNLSTFFNLA